jgi:hypothetical protein
VSNNQRKCITPLGVLLKYYCYFTSIICSILNPPPPKKRKRKKKCGFVDWNFLINYFLLISFSPVFGFDLHNAMAHMCSLVLCFLFKCLVLSLCLLYAYALLYIGPCRGSNQAPLKGVQASRNKPEAKSLDHCWHVKKIFSLVHCMVTLFLKF